MSTLQLQAGSIPDSIRSFILEYDFTSEDELAAVLNSLSYFDVRITGTQEKKEDINPLFCVAENLVSRGLPTRPSLYVEERINELMRNSGIQVDEDITFKKLKAISYWIEDNRKFAWDLWRALHVIDPLEGCPDVPTVQPGSEVHVFGSDAEQTFYEEGICRYFPSYFAQLLESEREVQSLIGERNDQLVYSMKEEFKRQRVDFSVEIPYSSKPYKGVVFEIDGEQHNQDTQARLDRKREDVLIRSGYRVCRIPAKRVNDPSESMDEAFDLLDEDYFTVLQENIDDPLRSYSLGICALQSALTSFACSRIQKSVLHLANEGYLDESAESWNIVVLERDIPCAELAFEDLKRNLSSLSTLSGIPGLPSIELTIITQEMLKEQFIDCLNLEPCDLLLDISILRRSFENDVTLNIAANVSCVIRSGKSIASKRKIRYAENITYLPLGKMGELDEEEFFFEHPDQVEALRFILRNIFRKVDFRPGQVRILDYSLQNNPVIGLLPTGSGKSLIYQLSALLQPGTCVVIDPLKSLMRDQWRGLMSNGIDSCLYINSSLNARERQEAIARITGGECLFAFVAPERFQIEEFRKEMKSSSTQRDISFSYCVIDEAHCVSEWGHEFRTPYLCVGQNARKYCVSWGREEVPLIALTATASFDVLADIQRELGIIGGESVVTLSTGEMRRKELTYQVVRIDSGIDSDAEKTSAWSIRESIGQNKVAGLSSLLSKIDFEDSPSLVFCPHRTGISGVKDVESHVVERLESGEWRSGTFTGSYGETQKEQEENEAENQQVQDWFISGDIDLLFATKAFGMGIDKPNIRNVVHFNIPSSIEGYYQEAGRAGRDREDSTCTILYCPEKFDNFQDRNGNKQTYDADILLSFHRNSFKGQRFEKFQIFELLNEIRFPQQSPLTAKLDSELRQFDEDGYCRFWPADKCKPTRLYINQDYGYFDLSSSDLLFVKGVNVLESDAIDGLRSVLASVDGNYSTQTIVHKEPGIEKRLSEKTEGERFAVLVPFSNDVETEIINLIGSWGIRCTLKDVRKAAGFCAEGNEFVDGLERELKFSLQNDERQKLNAAFYKIRTQESTMKAIYRLLTIGVIDDYSIDYASKEITCYVIKRSDEGYKRCLQDYLLKYFSEERVAAEMETLSNRSGNTVLQKCVNLLIDFTYKQIATQRRESIQAMEAACEYGLDTPELFEEYIMMYMSSRYARTQYLPKDTEGGRLESLDIVYRYAEMVRKDPGGEINNLKHLRGAATLLHTQYPDNYVFLLLKSLATFVLEKGRQKYVDQAFDDALDGFERVLKLDPDHSIDVLMRDIDVYAEEIMQFDAEAVAPVHELKTLFIHKRHLDWLKSYQVKKPFC